MLVLIGQIVVFKYKFYIRYQKGIPVREENSVLQISVIWVITKSHIITKHSLHQDQLCSVEVLGCLLPSTP